MIGFLVTPGVRRLVTMACLYVALLVFSVSFANAKGPKPFHATVRVLNLMNESAVFVDCYDSTGIVLDKRPSLKEIPPGETDTFLVNATHFFEGMEGYCWWNVSSSAESECGRGNGTYPNKNIHSCPWVGYEVGRVRAYACCD